MQSKGLRGALRNSAILSALDRFSDAVYAATARSVIGSALTRYDLDADAPSRSLLSFFGERLGLARGVSVPTKRTLGYFCERSFVIRTIKRLAQMLLHVSVQVYGIGLFSAGMYTAIMYLISRFALGNENAEVLSLFIGAACAILSVPLMFSQQPLGEAICRSRLGSLIFITIFGFRSETVCDGSHAVGKNTAAFVTGMIVGLSTYYIPPFYIVIGVVGLVAAYMLLAMPEIGVLAMFAALPFLPTMYIAGIVAITAVCFILKLVRGKRTLRFELLDVAVLIFMLFTLCGGLFSINRSLSLKPALLYICFIVGYFLVVNLIRTLEWAYRCAGALLASAFVVSAIGIYENFFGQLDLTWIDSEMFEDIEGRVVSTFANPNVLAEFLILTLPFALAVLLAVKKPPAKLGMLIMFIASVLCLVFTWSRGAWLGLMLGFLIFFFVYSRRTVSVLCFGLFALPFLPLILPSSIVERFTSIGNLADTSTAYRVHIWMGSLKMARDVFVSGLGSGMGIFSAVYPHYSLGGIEAAPHSHNLYLELVIELGLFGLLAFMAVAVIFIQSSLTYCKLSAGSSQPHERLPRLLVAAGLCGIVAFMAQGMTDYVWYNFRVYAMFWLALALTSAISRCASSELLQSREPII
jgi:Lipid A core - O-antigen ligase and related enzymes